METFLDLENVETAIQHIMEEMAERPTSWTTWTATLCYFLDTLEEDDAQHWPVPHHIVQARLRTLLAPSCWNLDRPLVKPTQALEELEQECRDVAITDWSAAHEVPRDFCRHRVLLHIFSGRRRPGDVQYFLDRMDGPSHYLLHVVSMDVVVDAVWGDAMAVGTRDYWTKAALDGWWPFLQARHVKRGQRPVDKAAPWTRTASSHESFVQLNTFGGSPVWHSRNWLR